jgi:3-isopropylmalate/(R)-2-methylmalate dehydratase small subunit
LKNGLVPIVVDNSTHQWLLANPGAAVEIDIARGTLLYAGGKSLEFSIDNFARYCLVEGIDQLGFLRQRLQDNETFEKSRPWMP